MGDAAPGRSRDGEVSPARAESGTRVVLRARGDAAAGFLAGHGRVRDRRKAGGAVAGSAVRGPQEAGVRGVRTGSSADGGAAAEAENDEQVQEVLEVVPPFRRVWLRGDRSCECVSGIGSDGRGKVVWEAGLLFELVQLGWGLYCFGGQFLGCVL